MIAASIDQRPAMLIRTLAIMALLSTPTIARADTLLDRLLADARAVGPDDFAWTRTTRSEQRGAGEVEVRTYVERWDPSRPAAQRWTLVSMNGRTPTPDELKDHAKSLNSAPVPNYGRLTQYLTGQARRDDASGHPVYRATGLAKGTMVVGRNDLSASASVEAHVTPGPQPFVERLHTISTKPFRMMLVAKVDRVEAVSRYKLMPDGRPVPIEQVSEMRGSMMGKSGTVRTISTYSDHRAVKRTN